MYVCYSSGMTSEHTITDTESLVILALAGEAGAGLEYMYRIRADVTAIAVAADALQERGLLEQEGAERYPTAEAVALASQHEENKVRAAALARQAAKA